MSCCYIVVLTHTSTYISHVLLLYCCTYTHQHMSAMSCCYIVVLTHTSTYISHVLLLYCCTSHTSTYISHVLLLYCCTYTCQHIYQPCLVAIVVCTHGGSASFKGLGNNCTGECHKPNSRCFGSGSATASFELQFPRNMNSNQTAELNTGHSLCLHVYSVCISLIESSMNLLLE